MPDFTSEASDVAVRFHRDGDWSVAHRDGDVRVWRVHTPGERAVDLFIRLSSHLEAVVDVVIEHPRDGVTWHGDLQFLPEVREALGRLRWPLASSGGVELTLVTADDQLTLMPSLELVIYARNDRWVALLEAEGIQPRERAPRALWQPAAATLPPAPELSAALATMADRLGLEAGT